MDEIDPRCGIGTFMNAIAVALFIAGLSLAGPAIAVEESPAASPAEATAPQAEGGAPAFEFGPDDVAHPEGLPELGKWMIDPDGTVAHWLGATYQSRHIREPINVVLVDHGAASPTAAKARLVDAATAAGYPSRRGHSGGYRGFIGGEMYDQLPEEAEHAFSNALYVFDNDHGRIFGPAPFAGGYLFIAAFSRERVAPFETLKHQYSSFDRARDDFTQRLDANSGYQITGFVDMDNAIIGDDLVSTGDHDGRAVLLEMRD